MGFLREQKEEAEWVETLRTREEEAARMRGEKKAEEARKADKVPPTLTIRPNRRVFGASLLWGQTCPSAG